MALQRRRFLGLAGAVAAMPALPRLALAQTYPNKPVRWIVGFATGGTTDIVSRVLTHYLTERLGQPFVVEGRPGAGSNLGAELVVRSPPDGHTLLLAGTPNVINTTLYRNLSFNFSRDIAPVAGMVRVPAIMVVHPSVPATTVREFIAYAKANPGKINMASSGVGSSPHMAGELFKMMAGVDVQHVPYRGAAPAMTDLLAGQVQLYFVTTPVSIGYLKTGRLRPLAATTTERVPELPDVPTIGEFVPGYEATAWYGVGAPRGTPSSIIETLNKEINAGLADPKVQARYAELGCTLLPGSASDFAKLIADETEKWAKVVQFSGAKVE